jgi:hypothetical protein
MSMVQDPVNRNVPVLEIFHLIGVLIGIKEFGMMARYWPIKVGGGERHDLQNISSLFDVCF